MLESTDCRRSAACHWQPIGRAEQAPQARTAVPATAPTSAWPLHASSRGGSRRAETAGASRCESQPPAGAILKPSRARDHRRPRLAYVGACHGRVPSFCSSPPFYDLHPFSFVLASTQRAIALTKRGKPQLAHLPVLPAVLSHLTPFAVFAVCLCFLSILFSASRVSNSSFSNWTNFPFLILLSPISPFPFSRHR